VLDRPGSSPTIAALVAVHHWQGLGDQLLFHYRWPIRPSQVQNTEAGIRRTGIIDYHLLITADSSGSGLQ